MPLRCFNGTRIRCFSGAVELLVEAGALPERHVAMYIL